MTGAANSRPISAFDSPWVWAYRGTASQVMPSPKFHAKEAKKNTWPELSVSWGSGSRPTAMRFALFLLLLALEGAALAASCKAESGNRTVALVELYTSEGCSSCPPADRWLSGLAARGFGAGRVVPLALHVDYWDYIGWKDPYGRREFSLRQRKLSQLQRMALVYTPQVLIQGRDFPRWGRSGE